MQVNQILRMKINMKEKAKKLFYKLLNDGKILDIYPKNIIYQIEDSDNAKPYIAIKWTWTESVKNFENPLTLESTINDKILQFKNEGKCLTYYVIIGGCSYVIELDDIEINEISYVISKKLREFQENRLDEIYKSIHPEPDPLYGNLLENEN